jgi:putative hemolysin
MRRVVLLAFLLAFLPALVACSHGQPAPRQAEPQGASPINVRMDTFEMNGYTLAGAEYWPYVGKEDINYPHDVLWGFYPEKGVIPPGETEANVDTANPAAVYCAQESFAALQVFLAKNPPELRQIVERGATKGYVPRFYLWTNDYSKAATPFPPGVREARLWYWMRKQPEPPKPPGYWKWEATLTQNGECQIPRDEQIQKILAETLAKL